MANGKDRRLEINREGERGKYVRKYILRRLQIEWDENNVGIGRKIESKFKYNRLKIERQVSILIERVYVENDRWEEKNRVKDKRFGKRIDWRDLNRQKEI